MVKPSSLYPNIDAKRKRIKKQMAAGKTPKKMPKVGSKGAPTQLLNLLS
tara:strand:- start:348 stop:494 length:147 start_codon:yes stop_codon:yes gene_type:complete